MNSKLFFFLAKLEVMFLSANPAVVSCLFYIKIRRSMHLCD